MQSFVVSFKKLDDILCKLSLSENDVDFSIACDLCIAHDRQAFLDGIHVDMRLFSELAQLTNSSFLTVK